VRLAEGAELPTFPPVERQPTQPAPPEQCAPPREADRQPVALGRGRTLARVLVAAAEFDTAPPHVPATHRIRIQDCRLTPMFVAATRGDTLELVNETDYPFMPVAGGAGVAQALMNGETRSIPLDQGGVKNLGCTFAAPCGRADVVTLYHPLHTLSDAAGRFRLEVPAGEELEIHAWHPLFEEASEAVTVPAGETRRVDLVLRPATPPTPIPGEATPTEDAESEPAVEDGTEDAAEGEETLF
jgi:hypothetical protein